MSFIPKFYYNLSLKLYETGEIVLKKLFKVLTIIFCCLAVFIIILFMVSNIISPKSAGKEIAARKGLPYHAVVGHRGGSYYVPENTVPAFVMGREIGADYLECDVQRTKDGKLIIFHDDTPERTTDAYAVYPGREKDPIGSFTCAELMKLNAGSWFNKKNPERARDSFKKIKICTFEEYVETARGSINNPGLLIELKAPKLYPGIEKEVIDVLIEKRRVNNPKANKERPDMLQSFDRDSVAKCKELAPFIPRNYLVAEKGDPDTKWDDRGWQGLLDDAVSMNAEIAPSGRLAYPWYTGKAHQRNLLMIVWTLDDDWQFWMLTQFGIDWIITNRCDKALEFYGRQILAKPEDVFNKFGL